jgi:hypothetical protein
MESNMTTTQVLENLKNLIDECQKETPNIDMTEVINTIVVNGHDYSNALSKAIRSLS